MNQNEILQLVEYCREKLDLATARESEEYRYYSLPLCIIDAVFSIGVRYISTANVVRRFCEYFSLPRIRSSNDFPPITTQFSVKELIALYERFGLEQITEHIYHNHQRTSTKNGILKSEAVQHFAKVLLEFNVNYFQDVDKILNNPIFENKIQQIPGQTSGVSLRYFYMLAGSSNYIKPDRMIERFTEAATGRKLTITEMHQALTAACQILANEYPQITPRLLDHTIWNSQRQV